MHAVHVEILGVDVQLGQGQLARKTGDIYGDLAGLAVHARDHVTIAAGGIDGDGGPLLVITASRRRVERFDRVQQFLAVAERGDAQLLEIVGRQAAQQENAGIELALSINQALPHCATTLITGGAPLANASSASTRQLLAKTLKRQKITVLADAATVIKPSEIILASGARLACDVPVLAIAANPPALAAASALALDAQGFVAVDSNSRCISHPNVFAVPDSDLLGDRLAQLLIEATGLPFASGSRSGAGRLSRLQFVASAQGHAIASWGGYSATGRVSAWLKQLADQHRMDSYRPL